MHILNQKCNSIAAADLGCMSYSAAHALQLEILDLRIQGRFNRDICLILEHMPVYTLGRSGGVENILRDPGFLKEKGIEVVQTERGGDVTYHGPGQLVVYFILNLEGLKLSISSLVDRLEGVMIDLSAKAGVSARRNPENHGVWVGNKKLGSIGLAVRHGFTFHGIALNVDPDLTPFSWINPCGLSNQPMTSLSRESEAPVSMQGLKLLVPKILGCALNGPVRIWTEAGLWGMGIKQKIR